MDKKFNFFFFQNYFVIIWSKLCNITQLEILTPVEAKMMAMNPNMKRPIENAKRNPPHPVKSNLVWIAKMLTENTTP